MRPLGRVPTLYYLSETVVELPRKPKEGDGDDNPEMVPVRVKEILSNICDSLDSFDSCGKLLEFFFNNIFELGLVLEGSNFNLKDFPESLIQPITSTLMREQRNIAMLFDDVIYQYMWLNHSVTEKWESQQGNASFICRLRSGVAFLFDHFTGLSKDLDCALNEINSDFIFDLDTFDGVLKGWGSYSGYFEPDDFNPEDPRIPKSHFWWSLPCVKFPGGCSLIDIPYHMPDFVCTKHLNNQK